MIKIKGLTLLYDSRSTDGISDVSFEIPKGSFVSIIGPSGSGKTTTLKCLANMITDYTGSIEISEKEVISYVDQIPTFDLEESVFNNLANSMDNKEDELRIENAIRMSLSQLDLTNEINTKIKDLSGGQRQRVTIAKSLIQNPTVLLLDEPFANLDKVLRLQLFDDLLPILKEKEISVVWVTHSQEEALRYSDKVVLLNFGIVQQIGTPEDLYFRPSNLFTAKFFGETNVTVSTIDSLTETSLAFSFKGLNVVVPSPQKLNINEKTDLVVCLKPEYIKLGSSQDGVNFIGTIEANYFLGANRLLKLNFGENFLWAKCSGDNNLVVGEEEKFYIDKNNFHFLSEV